jgi:hypothetical protein
MWPAWLTGYLPRRLTTTATERRTPTANNKKSPPAPRPSFKDLPPELKQRIVNYLQRPSNRNSARKVKRMEPFVVRDSSYSSNIGKRFDRRMHAGTANVEDANELVMEMMRTGSPQQANGIKSRLKRFIAATGKTPSVESTHLEEAEVHHLQALAAMGVPVHGVERALAHIRLHLKSRPNDHVTMHRLLDLLWFRWSHENPSVELTATFIDALGTLYTGGSAALGRWWPAIAAVAKKPATAEYLFDTIFRWAQFHDVPIDVDVARTLVDRIPKKSLDCLLLNTAFLNQHGQYVRNRADIVRVVLEAGADPWKSVHPSSCYGSDQLAKASRRPAAERLVMRTSYGEALLRMFLPYGDTRAKSFILQEHVKTLIQGTESPRERHLLTEIKPYLFPDNIKMLQYWYRRHHNSTWRDKSSAFVAVFSRGEAETRAPAPVVRGAGGRIGPGVLGVTRARTGPSVLELTRRAAEIEARNRRAA